MADSNRKVLAYLRENLNDAQLLTVARHLSTVDNVTAPADLSTALVMLAQRFAAASIDDLRQWVEWAKAGDVPVRVDTAIDSEPRYPTAKHSEEDWAERRGIEEWAKNLWARRFSSQRNNIPSLQRRITDLRVAQSRILDHLEQEELCSAENELARILDEETRARELCFLASVVILGVRKDVRGDGATTRKALDLTAADILVGVDDLLGDE